MKDMRNKIIDILAYNLYCELKMNNVEVITCDDKQCDNEECVLFRALDQYMKYEFDKANEIGISFEMHFPKDNKE